MLARRKQVGTSHQIKVSLGVISCDLIDNVLNADHLRDTGENQSFDARSITKR
jgi:hypothetical protein